MKITRRRCHAVLAPVSILILLCSCSDLVSSRSTRSAEHPLNDADTATAADCERVKPFFESKKITIVTAKLNSPEDVAKSK